MPRFLKLCLPLSLSDEKFVAVIYLRLFKPAAETLNPSVIRNSVTGSIIPYFLEDNVDLLAQLNSATFQKILMFVICAFLVSYMR